MRAFTLQEAITYGKGVERPFLCPVHGDSRPSASLNMVKKVWYCYSCGASGGLTGENALLEPDWEYLQKWFNQKLEEARVYPESWLARWDAGPVHPYWLGRVGEPAARHFRLGYDPENDAVVYPLRETDGSVIGVVRRALAGEGPKYLYPRGVDVGDLLFNYSPEARRTVVLVEGALDAVALWNVGITAFAIYGAQLSPTQIKLIDRVDPEFVWCAYDNDDAGFQAYLQTKRAFKHRIVHRLTWARSWGKDVDELGHRLPNVVTALAWTDPDCIESRSWQQPRPPSPSLQITRSSSRTSSSPGSLRIVRTPS